MNQIAQHLFQVKERIAQAAERASRNLQQIRLLAVSKTKPVEAVMAAHAAGQRCFGESYAQEAATKIDTLRQQPEYCDIEWHFIGPLQSNKSKLVAERFDWVQSVDRDKLIDRLNNQRPASMAPLNVCLQINISGESSKSGTSEQEIFRLAELVSQSERLVLRGLMAIPEPAGDFDEQRAPHRALSELLAAVNARGLALDTLSMGMSADLEAAVAEGATILRVGTAIFGGRG